jgi:hypothetical protein
VSTFTEISGCFQPDQAKVVLGPSPLVHLQQGAGGGIPLVPGQTEDEEELPGGTGVWQMGKGQDLKTQDGGADPGGHH